MHMALILSGVPLAGEWQVSKTFLTTARVLWHELRREPMLLSTSDPVALAVHVHAHCMCAFKAFTCCSEARTPPGVAGNV